MGRKPCCEKVGLKKGSWTADEDHKLVSYIQQHGHGGWSHLPSKAGLQRCGKSCRLRWMNYLRPDIKRGKFNAEEEETIIRLHALLGNRWSAIANHLPERTDNEIKNYWNVHMKKRLIKLGIDPITHRRRISGVGIGLGKNAANLSHMAQWENARLEAEGRLVREVKLVSGPNHLVKKNNSAQLFDKPTLSRLVPPQPICLDVLPAWQGIMLSNVSNRITLESPTSTLNYSNNAPTIPKVGLVDNQCMSMVNYVAGMRDEGVIVEQNFKNEGVIMEQNFQNDSKIVESSIIPQTLTEKMENSIEVHEMVYPSNVFPINKGDFAELFDVTNTYNLTENNNVDLEENWYSILNNLAISSPLGSVCFLN